MKILVADDDCVARYLVEASLKSLGHDVLSCSDGASAWKLIHDNHPQVVVSDWMMPGVDGLELCRRLRLEAGSRVYFILISSVIGSKESMGLATDAGVDACISKPFINEQLIHRIRAAEDSFGDSIHNRRSA